MRQLLVIALLFGAQYSHAQDFGYLGKKNIVSVFSTTNFRAFAAIDDFLILNDSYGYSKVKYSSANTMKTSKKYARYDLRVSYARIVSPKISVGAEFAYETMKLTRMRVTRTWSTPVVHSQGYFFTLGFNNEDRFSTLGFSTVFGIGPRFYSFDQNQNYRYNSNHPMNAPMPDYKKGWIGLDGFFQMSVRALLTRSLVLDIGMRFHTGAVFLNGRTLNSGQTVVTQEYNYSDNIYEENNGTNLDQYYTEMEDVSIWSKEEIRDRLQNERLSNFASFRIGIGFLF